MLQQCMQAITKPEVHVMMLGALCIVQCALRYKNLQNKESKKELNNEKHVHRLCQPSSEEMQLLIISWLYYLNMNAY